MAFLQLIGTVVWMAFRMLWQILWGLSLGFALSAVLEVMVSKEEMAALLPDHRAKSVVRAGVMGMVSSSCSYAAVAMARSIIRKGGDFTAAMCFQFAATNLVIELGVLLWILLGWQFALAEFVGGTLMIMLISVGLRLFMPEAAVAAATHQAKGSAKGAMEGHAAMAMAQQKGTWRERLASRKGWIAVSHHYVMNWSMVWKDIAVGVVIAAALSKAVPEGLWHRLFFQGHGLWSTGISAFIGPLIAMAAFTCSIGNVPLAAILWNGGIRFGGVVAFIFGDLIILPILNIYRKVYGLKASARMLVAFYLAMVMAALAVEGLFGLMGAIPASGGARIADAAIRLNYTTGLNILFGGLGLSLLFVFLKTGGPKMMRMMSAGGDHPHGDTPREPDSCCKGD